MLLVMFDGIGEWCCSGCRRGASSQMSWRVSPVGCCLCRLSGYRVSWGVAGGV